jgi:hypothetical protein
MVCFVGYPRSVSHPARADEDQGGLVVVRAGRRELAVRLDLGLEIGGAAFQRVEEELDWARLVQVGQREDGVGGGVERQRRSSRAARQEIPLLQPAAAGLSFVHCAAGTGCLG